MKKLVLATVALAALACAAPAQADKSMDAALITVAAATFVQATCPKMEPNMMMMAARLKDLGVTEADLTSPARMRQAGLYLTMFKADPKASCKMLREQFGPDGTNLPGLFDVE